MSSSEDSSEKNKINMRVYKLFFAILFFIVLQSTTCIHPIKVTFTNESEKQIIVDSIYFDGIKVSQKIDTLMRSKDNVRCNIIRAFYLPNVYQKANYMSIYYRSDSFSGCTFKKIINVRDDISGGKHLLYFQNKIALNIADSECDSTQALFR